MNDTAASPAPAAPGVISTATAAALLMVTPEWIRRLTLDGWITKQGKDQFRVQDVVQGYIKYLRDENRTSSKSASASRVQDARAEEIALRTDERRNRLLAEAQAEALGIIDEYFGGLRADINSLPARLTTDLAMRKRLKDGIDVAFDAAARKAIAAASLAPEAGAALRKAGKPSSRPVGKRKPRVSAKSRRTRSARSKPDPVHNPV